jgi:hypothetical protein
MRYGQLADRAHKLEQAATFARTLARYVVETETNTVGEALERLQALHPVPRSTSGGWLPPLG